MMKLLISILIGLLVVGCGKTEPLGSGNEYNAGLAIDQNTTTAKPVKELTLEEKIVGTYEKKFDEGTMKLVILENGTVEKYKNGEKTDDFEWKIVGEEVHLGDGMPPVGVCKIEPNGDLTTIAEIDGRGRKDYSKEDQMTFKKIKTEDKAAKAEAAVADAKVIEAAIRRLIKKPTGELTKADLKEVAHLSFRGKKLTEVPKGLEMLTQLTELWLDDNKLTDVRDLENLAKLESLLLSDNKLTELPKGLEKLTQLKDLYINNNKLKVVKDLENLTQLTWLELSSNQLTDLKGLEKLTKLEFLNLYNNQLTDLKGLEKLTQLGELELRDNPDLTKAQIDELQKALPNCRIISNPTK
jgi:hypothetical protein